MATAEHLAIEDSAVKRAEDCDGSLAQLIDDYRYQPDLTKSLDALGSEDFTPEIIKDIVLWKVNRYVKLSEETLAGLNRGASCEPKSHRDARPELEALLREPGVDLPMASSFLRFRNPQAFQIIDRHAYRALYGAPYPLHSSSNDSRKVDFYFSYIDDLFVLAESKGVAFEQLDRVLYIFDKQQNGKL